MKILFKKIISLIMVLIMVIVSSANLSYAKEQQTVTVNGYTFNIIDHNIDNIKLSYTDDNGNYVFNLNKNGIDGKSSIQIIQENNNKRGNLIDTYEVRFDKTVNYTSSTKDLSNTILINSDTGEEYTLNPNAKFAIPLGIPLGMAAIQALLIVGSAIVIAGIVYIIAEEIAQSLQKQKQYYYYNAILYNNSVYIGGALTKNAAKAAAYTDNQNGTIMAVSFQYARGLTGNNFIGPENHGAGDGWWLHIHAVKANNQRYKAHIWYLGV